MRNRERGTKGIALGLVTMSMMGVLSGCTASGLNVSKVPPMTLDEVAGRRLVMNTNAEREAEMYKAVSERIMVEPSRLLEVNEKDRKNIAGLFGEVNTMLQGGNSQILPEEYANYLLLEFAKTPYEWQQTSMDIVGFDPAARLYFVDVTYGTTGVHKKVVPDSKIAVGSKDEERMKERRYTEYIAAMTFKYKGQADRYEQAIGNFENRWGSIDAIMKEQQGTSLLTRTKQEDLSSGGIGKLTYSGMVSDGNLATGATKTVRYVLKYRLNLGEEVDLMVDALYLKDYKLNSMEKVMKGYDASTVGSVEVLKPFIDQLILSYNKAVEESNFVGLASLFEDFSQIDKYYEEMRDYTYNSIGGYTYRVIHRNGSNVAVEVNRLHQIRARGANMSLPTYDEKLIFNLVLGRDDQIKIKSVHTVEKKMIGEPLSVIRNVSGISDKIQYVDASFTKENKDKVETLLKKFSKVVTNSEIETEEFLQTIDLGVEQTTLNRVVDTIVSVKSNRKAMYIINWDTKTNVYASVRVREVFELEDRNLDTEAVIDMVNRNGDWRVVNYTRLHNIKTGKSVLDKDKAFTLDERSAKGEVTRLPEHVQDYTGTNKKEQEELDLDVYREDEPEPEIVAPAPIVNEPVENSSGDTEPVEQGDGVVW